MDKTFKEVSIQTNIEEKHVSLKVGGTYGDEIKIPFIQLNMIINLLDEANRETVPRFHKAVEEMAEGGGDGC